MCSEFDDPSMIEEVTTIDCARCDNPTTAGNLRMVMYFIKLQAVCVTCSIALDRLNAKVEAIIGKAV